MSRTDPAVTEASLRELLAADLGMSASELADDANLLELGFDSLRLMAWLNRLRAKGGRMTLRQLFAHPTPGGWGRLLDGAPAAAEPLAERERWPVMRDGTRFALTPVQHAYLVGRGSEQTLGGVGCHLYQEFDGQGLTAAMLEGAVDRLLSRHPMLTAVFHADGHQQWSPPGDRPRVHVHDLRRLSPADAEARLAALRRQLSHRVLPVETGQTFDVQLSLLPDGRHRLHVDIDLLVMDAASFTLFFEELAALANAADLPAPDADYDFRSYLEQRAAVTADDRASAIRHWRERLDTLPAAPDLPLTTEPATLTQARTTRRRFTIDRTAWSTFVARAGSHGITPTMALVTCFGAILSRWSGQDRLLLNMTLFDREPLHPAVAEMIADFTNILLLDLDCHGADLATLAQANQAAFADAYDHRHWSGVEVMRTVRRQGRHPHGAPVVFTSALGRPLYGRDTARTLGVPGWGRSQTPQVWLDQLVFEEQDAICLQWDSVDTLFPEGMMDTLFSAYQDAVQRLTDDGEAWTAPWPDVMPSGQYATRAAVNATAVPVPAGCLHDPVFARATHNPETVALIHGERTVTHTMLADAADRVAAMLAAEGVAPGDRVAIAIGRGIGQVVSVLGVLRAGAVYVPLVPDQPEERRALILAAAGISVTLGEGPSTTGRLDWRRSETFAPIAQPVAVDPGDPAYVIYTSGSTGIPKGVAISHRAALNTCCDIVRRQGVGAEDRILALSALHFDLSVFDLFGVLGAGGAIVLIDEEQYRDPAAWCALIERHGVTLWNSVPALFDMLLTYAEGFDAVAPARLRCVLLSGDWIGLDLPPRYRAFRPAGRLVAMGGATEAAIWSNVHDVDEVAPNWRSIPYGRPLANQCYRVVDPIGRDCPDQVPGELWIGGIGVALGYLGDAERTARQFVERDGTRWYRTGDIGCYWPDGTLEFLGRRDDQVKIGGYRIELGEVEVALVAIPGVRSGIAVALGDREKTLIAAVVAEGPSLCRAIDAAPALADRIDVSLPDVPASAIPDPAALVAAFLRAHLSRQGIDGEQPADIEAVMRGSGATPRWRPLVERWLAFLVAYDKGATGGARDSEHAMGGLRAIADAMPSHHAVLAATLRDERDPRLLVNDPVWAPERLLLLTGATDAALATLRTTIVGLARRLGRPVRLVEIGARTGLAAERLLLELDQAHVACTLLDESQDMVLRAGERFARQPHVRARRCTAAMVEELRHTADILVANNALHGRETERLALLPRLAAPGALIHVLELRHASPLALISADLLEGGAATGDRLRAPDDWRQRFASLGLAVEGTEMIGDQQRLLLRAPSVVHVPDATILRSALAQRLPGYMLPHKIVFLDAMPLTDNGKIDRAALAGRVSPGTPTERAAPRAGAERLLADVWQRLLEIDTIDREGDFFQLGGDSLLATRSIAELARLGKTARLADLFADPRLSAFAATLLDALPASDIAIRHDAERRYAPFPLTAVQQAYLVGHQPELPLGGVGAHLSLFFAVENLDIPRFEAAWDRLVARHDMLRAAIVDDRQQVLPTVDPFTLAVHMVPALDGPEARAVQDDFARQVLDSAAGRPFDIRAISDGGTTTLLCFCLDNLMLDGASMQIVLAELASEYLDPDHVPAPPAITFRDYVTSRVASAGDAAETHWRQRIESLPPAPQLPLATSPEQVGIPRFTRRSGHLPAEHWRRLKDMARQTGLTPSGLVLAAYCATLSASSTSADLTVNLTLFDRAPDHPDIDRVLGDFTALMLVAWRPRHDWRASVTAFQRRLGEDLSHRGMSAIEVMRRIARHEGRPLAAMPVVFTSALGVGDAGFLSANGWLKPRGGLSQTPQTWLDLQVYEADGALHFDWDAVEALMGATLLDVMIADFTGLLVRLATDPAAWDLATDRLLPRRHAIAPPAPATPPPMAIAQHDPVTEEAVAKVAAAFLRIVGQPIAPTQNFFDAGASSLQLVRLHVALRDVGLETMTMVDMFAYPSPRALAIHATTRADRAAPDADDRRRHLDRRRATRTRRNGGKA